MRWRRGEKSSSREGDNLGGDLADEDLAAPEPGRLSVHGGRAWKAAKRPCEGEAAGGNPDACDPRANLAARRRDGEVERPVDRPKALHRSEERRVGKECR